MFNLLRMDLYRVKRSKSTYVCFGVLMIATVLAFVMLWLMATPQGHEWSVRMGMLSPEEVKKSTDLLNSVDLLKLFRQICLDGGMYNVVFGIWTMLFVCADYRSGFIKNIMALHQDRYNYIGSKILAAGIVNFCYLVLHFLGVLLMNRLFGDMVPYTRRGDIVFYLTWAWLLTTAFSALVILICILTRSVAAGSVAAVLLGGGAVVMPLYGILNTFHIGEWLKYTIYMTLSMGPGQYTAVRDLRVYATGAGFLILYTVIAGIVLKNQDI